MPKEEGCSKIFEQILKKHSVTVWVCWAPYPSTLLIDRFNLLGTEPHHDICKAAHATFLYPAEHKGYSLHQCRVFGFPVRTDTRRKFDSKRLRKKKSKCIRDLTGRCTKIGIQPQVPPLVSLTVCNTDSSLVMKF